MNTRIGGTSVGDMEKAGRKADSVQQSIEKKQFYETEEEKRQFIRKIFQLDTKEILNADAKLKEAVIKLFLDNFEVLASHLSQYGENEVLEMKIYLVPGVIPFKSRVRLLNPDQKDNLRDQIDEWLEAWSNQTFSESIGITSNTCEEEGLTDKMGQRFKRIK